VRTADRTSATLRLATVHWPQPTIPSLACMSVSPLTGSLDPAEAADAHRLIALYLLPGFINPARVDR